MYDTILTIAFSAFFLAGAVLTVGFLTVLIVDEELRAKGGAK